MGTRHASSATGDASMSATGISNWNADHIVDPCVSWYPTSETGATGWTADGANAISKLNTCNNIPNIYTETAVGTLGTDYVFSSITGVITHIIVRVRYLSGAASHTCNVKMWDYSIGTPAWSASLASVTGTSMQFSYIVIPLSAADAAKYVSGGAARLNIAHNGSGTAGHILEVDYVCLRFNPDYDESTTDPVISRLLAVRQLTSSTTYTPTAGTAYVHIKAIAAGGGGGSAYAAASQCVAQAGGGSGSYFEHIFPITNGRTCAYTLGTGGTNATPSSASGVAGGNGTTTTFTVPITESAVSTVLTANGGTGGGVMTSATTAGTQSIGGAGGAISTGSPSAPMYVGTGERGANGIRVSGTVGASGGGGNAFPFGAGGASIAAAGSNSAAGYGAGGGGALRLSAAGTAGGAGGNGCIIVYEYT